MFCYDNSLQHIFFQFWSSLWKSSKKFANWRVRFPPNCRRPTRPARQTPNRRQWSKMTTIPSLIRKIRRWDRTGFFNPEGKIFPSIVLKFNQTTLLTYSFYSCYWSVFYLSVFRTMRSVVSGPILPSAKLQPPTSPTRSSNTKMNDWKWRWRKGRKSFQTHECLASRPLSFSNPRILDP